QHTASARPAAALGNNDAKPAPPFPHLGGEPLSRNAWFGNPATPLRKALAALGQARSVNEYVALQASCVAVADREELLALLHDPATNRVQWQDCLQVLYWSLDAAAREEFFLGLLREHWDEPKAASLQALVHRAALERHVRLGQPERAPGFAQSLKTVHARTLFVE
ncbi:MAG TPA: hypothetical protein VNZ22_08200, partial [Bacillota bacterium]|nr:hypothetical protein [Bacillota bacterium]